MASLFSEEYLPHSGLSAPSLLDYNQFQVLEKPTPFERQSKKIGRNALCPCGSGKKFYAFEPSADASRGVLRSKNFEGADTIKKLLDDQKLQEQLKDQVILIDEAGMVGTQTMNGIFEIAIKQNARVILSGDWKQHNSVEAGDAIRLLEQHT